MVVEAAILEGKELALSTSCVHSIASWAKKNVPASKSGPAKTGPAGPRATLMDQVSIPR